MKCILLRRPSPTKNVCGYRKYSGRLARIGRLATAIGVAALASAHALSGGPVPAVAPEDRPGQFLPGDLRKLATFDSGTPLVADFVERGASQFATLTPDGLAWAPTATNVYTLVLARRGVPRIVADQAITTEFRLSTENSSLGLHLHARDEDEASHLVLINRTGPARGLLRVYRTAVWPSGSIANDDMLPAAQARIPDFPADAWHRLVVTTDTDRASAQTTLYIQLLAADTDAQLAKLEARDPGLALPEAGLVALRLFGAAGSRIEVRSLVGQPQP